MMLLHRALMCSSRAHIPDRNPLSPSSLTCRLLGPDTFRVRPDRTTAPTLTFTHRVEMPEGYSKVILAVDLVDLMMVMTEGDHIITGDIQETMMVQDMVLAEGKEEDLQMVQAMDLGGEVTLLTQVVEMVMIMGMGLAHLDQVGDHLVHLDQVEDHLVLQEEVDMEMILGMVTMVMGLTTTVKLAVLTEVAMQVAGEDTGKEHLTTIILELVRRVITWRMPVR